MERVSRGSARNDSFLFSGPYTLVPGPFLLFHRSLVTGHWSLPPLAAALLFARLRVSFSAGQLYPLWSEPSNTR